MIEPRPEGGTPALSERSVGDIAELLQREHPVGVGVVDAVERRDEFLFSKRSVVGPSVVQTGISQTGTKLFCRKTVVGIRVEFSVGDVVQGDEPVRPAVIVLRQRQGTVAFDVPKTEDTQVEFILVDVAVVVRVPEREDLTAKGIELGLAQHPVTVTVEIREGVDRLSLRRRRRKRNYQSRDRERCSRHL